MWPAIGATTATPSNPWHHDCWTTCLRFSIKEQSPGVKLGQLIIPAGYLPFAFPNRSTLYPSSYCSLPWEADLCGTRPGFLLPYGFWWLWPMGNITGRSMGRQRVRWKVIIPSLWGCCKLSVSQALKPQVGPLHTTLVPGSGNCSFPHSFRLGVFTAPTKTLGVLY